MRTEGSSAVASVFWNTIWVALLIVPVGCLSGPDGSELEATASQGLEPTQGAAAPRTGCSRFPPTPCGEVQNDTQITVRVSLNWTCDESTGPLGTHCAQNIVSVNPGRHLGGGNVDVDAFEVPSGCVISGILLPGLTFSHGAGWYKFNSLQEANLSFASCPL